MTTYATTGIDLGIPPVQVELANPVYLNAVKIINGNGNDLPVPFSPMDGSNPIYLNKVKLYGSLGVDLPVPYATLNSATAIYLLSRKLYGPLGIDIPQRMKVIYKLTEHATELIYWSPLPSFPGNMQMTEILYPVIPLNAVNKVLTKMDSQEYRITQKSAAQFTRKVSTIRFRVDTSYMSTFFGDLYSNRLVQFRLTTLGYTPFGINSSDNWVRILNHTEPEREIGGLTYLVDVTFLFMATYP